MPLPEVQDLCDLLDEIPGDLCAVFPGGAEVCAYYESFPPSLLQLARALLAQASGALAPLQPIFNIIEAINSIVECIEAIPDTIGPPPNPDALAACIPNLLRKLERLLALLPQLSLPLLLIGLLDAIIAKLQGVINELRAIVDLLNRIAASKGISNGFLQSIIDCAEGTAAVSFSNLERLFSALNSTIELLNKLGEPVGMPEIPSFEGGLGDDPEEAIEKLQELVDTLRALRDTIPVE